MSYEAGEMRRLARAGRIITAWLKMKSVFTWIIIAPRKLGA